MNTRFGSFALALLVAGCGGNGVEGTYHLGEGNVVLELKADDQATLRTMGMDLACTYRVEAERIALTCPQMDPTLVSVFGSLGRNADGTLSSMIGALAKRPAS